MRTIEYFTESEIPYGTLAKFGLTREMIESLPEPVMSRLLSFRTTPVLPLVVEDNGKQVRCQGKIALVRKDGKVDVVFNPVWETNELESFTPDEQVRLKNGEVVYAEVMDKGKCFVQFDSELNKCMFVPGLIIDQNIDCLSESDAVDEKSILLLKNGQIVEITDGEDTVTVGIDLDTPSCLRIVGGNADRWKQEKEAESLPQYNFGLFGCWVNDGNNNLSYVDEEDYTDEMVEQQNLMASRNAATAQMNNMNNNYVLKR